MGGGFGKTVTPVRNSMSYSREILFYFISLFAIMRHTEKVGVGEGKSIKSIMLWWLLLFSSLLYSVRACEQKEYLRSRIMLTLEAICFFHFLSIASVLLSE